MSLDELCSPRQEDRDWSREESSVYISFTIRNSIITFMKKTFVTQREIKRYIRRRAALEKIFYIISFFVVPFVFYIAARHKYLFDDVNDEELQLYLDAERRYAIVTIIWLLSIIAILLLIVVVKI